MGEWAADVPRQQTSANEGVGASWILSIFKGRLRASEVKLRCDQQLYILLFLYLFRQLLSGWRTDY